MTVSPSRKRLWDRLVGLAEAEVRRTLDRLPTRLKEEAEALPVTFESRPNRALVRDGIQPDTLGLFVGEDFAQEGVSAEPLPAQIILFLDNLWEEAAEDERDFRIEVQKTYLHELGHYLGLNEHELELRDLE